MVVAGAGEGEIRRWNSEEMSVERLFECREVPTWGEQLTFRAFFVSFVLGILLCLIVMKLNLTTGIIPSLNVSAGLLGFFLVKTWTKALEKSGLLKKPFTRQENTVIQTCVVAVLVDPSRLCNAKVVNCRRREERASSLEASTTPSRLCNAKVVNCRRREERASSLEASTTTITTDKYNKVLPSNLML